MNMMRDYKWGNGLRLYRCKHQKKWFVLTDCPPRVAECLSIGFDVKQEAVKYKEALEAAKTPTISFWDLHKQPQFEGMNGF